VIIAPGDFERWLGPDESAGGLLRPPSADFLVAEPVSARVDSTRNEGPDLLAPVVR
jgi:putative SOS response-associated peptidase YedK